MTQHTHPGFTSHPVAIILVDKSHSFLSLQTPLLSSQSLVYSHMGGLIGWQQRQLLDKQSNEVLWVSGQKSAIGMHSPCFDEQVSIGSHWGGISGRS